jgi:hypothetical protein
LTAEILEPAVACVSSQGELRPQIRRRSTTRRRLAICWALFAGAAETKALGDGRRNGFRVIGRRGGEAPARSAGSWDLRGEPSRRQNPRAGTFVRSGTTGFACIAPAAKYSPLPAPMYRANAPPRLDHVPRGPPFRGSFPASPLGPGRACDPESRGRLFFRPLSCVLLKARDRERKEARRKFSLGPPRARGGSAAAPLFPVVASGFRGSNAAVAAERRELTSCSPADPTPREPPQVGAVLFRVFADRPGCNFPFEERARQVASAPPRQSGQRTQSHAEGA